MPISIRLSKGVVLCTNQMPFIQQAKKKRKREREHSQEGVCNPSTNFSGTGRKKNMVGVDFHLQKKKKQY